MSQAAAVHLQWQRDGDHAQTQFFAEGMHCANCAQSIRRHIGALEGVQQVEVNLATTRVSVGWQPSRLKLDAVLAAVEQLGFRPVPLIGAEAALARRRERRSALKRIGLAGLVAMQMSMYTVGLYAGAISGIDHDLEQLLRVTSMLLAIPVLFYAGAPFLRGAWSDLRRRSLGMDVPVAAALLLAFFASCYNTLRQTGQVYFDSVAMFVFFLLLGRFVEMTVRRGSLDASEALARSLPATVTRLRAEGGSERVALREVRIGDRLLIAHGAVVPVDASLLDATALLDESLLSGESVPVTHSQGARLLGGSVNLGAPVSVSAQADVRSSTLASMMALMERAQGERPRVARAADRAATGFVIAILLLSILVAAIWLWIDPSRAFEATLAVLVVTCPCALSLATPVAVAAATARLAKRGVLITRANALESLSQIDTVVLDKTGTLTGGEVRVGRVHRQTAVDEARCLAIAEALERASTHPLARAFAAQGSSAVHASEWREVAGQGVEGLVDGERYRIGRHEFVSELQAGAAVLAPAAAAAAPADVDDCLWLGSASGMLAGFEIVDGLRPGAREAVAALRAAGLELVIASGDRHGAVRAISRELDIVNAQGRLDPTAKLAVVRELQQRGRRVLMVGDGINDGPVLAAADVACAMGQGAAIAQSAADLLLMNESLAVIAEAVATARGNARLVRSNLRWALGYNLAAVPLAALGLVPPWLAAIGMSASSLYVVWRAQRFAKAAR